jgi:Uma2 family endonuclease
MNIQSKYPTTPDEFLRWNEGREGKREFVNGRVVEMMINVTRNHIEIATNLTTALRSQLDRNVFTVGSADFGVRTPDGIRFPDAFVDQKTGMAEPEDLTAIHPLFVAEVLSPSSFGRDFVEKMSDYRGIGSLLYYLILSHEEPRVWLSRRMGEEWSPPEELLGLEVVLDFGALGATLALSDVYAGVKLRGT